MRLLKADASLTPAAAEGAAAGLEEEREHAEKLGRRTRMREGGRTKRRRKEEQGMGSRAPSSPSASLSEVFALLVVACAYVQPGAGLC